MPLPVDKLRPQSSIEAISEAISESIAQLVHEGREQEQAAAIAYNIARRKTGKSLGGGRKERKE